MELFVQPHEEALMSAPEFMLTGLTGREYKMMLKPRKFRGVPAEAADRFWKNHLRPILDRHLDGSLGGSFKALFEPSVREVRFRDTEELLLDAHGYSFRCETGRMPTLTEFSGAATRARADAADPYR